MSLGDRIAIAAVAAAMAAIALGAWMVISPVLPVAGGADQFGLTSAAPLASVANIAGGDLVVDVEGGVRRPGIVRLPAGSRVADAIAAAGGYSAAVDLVLAAAQINLAAPLGDGEQVLVPMLGGAAAASSSAGPAGALVDLNHATPEQLDALPGIGPVTVQKIVAARNERPFATLDETVERKVLTSSQLDKIRDLVTVD